jgi:hypothetical protein
MVPIGAPAHTLQWVITPAPHCVIFQEEMPHDHRVALVQTGMDLLIDSGSTITIVRNAKIISRMFPLRHQGFLCDLKLARLYDQK